MREHAVLNYQRDGQACSAQEFYDVACDPMRHVVVEACAGAGKTWVLVARMARALWLGAAPDSILAITFTKKAAAEMRERLLNDLAAWAGLDDMALREQLALRGLHGVDAAGLARARGLHADLLASDRAVQVRTFHSWFAQLLRHAPMEVFRSLNLPAQHELLEDDSVASMEAWPLFLAALRADAALLADYRASVMAVGRSATQEALLAALARRTELRLADEAGVLYSSVAPVAEVCPRFAAWSWGEDPLQTVPAFKQALTAAALALGTGGKTPASRNAGRNLEIAVTSGDLLAAWSVLLTKTGSPRAKGLSCEHSQAVEDAQAWLLQWSDAQHQTQCLAHQGRMARLSRLLVQTYTALKQQRGWVDMNDLEAAASHLLADGHIAAWVQQRLDSQVQHLLVDEFQDTNPLQWHALHAWLEGYAGAGGGGQGLRVFIVGDPKQSIYRFRRADPRVFAHARQFAQDALGACVLACDHTRRCAQSVVSACNAVMAAIPRHGETAVEYRAHSAERPDDGEVWLLPLITEASPDEPCLAQAPDSVVASTNDPHAWRDSLTEARDVVKTTAAAREAQALARRLADHLARGEVQAHEVMVLARRNARLALLHEALNALGVPSGFAEKTPLIDAPVVADVVALLDAATAHGHDLSLARALKSPMFGATDAQLMAVARAAKSMRAPNWWETLQTADWATHVPSDLPADVWLARTRQWAADLKRLDQDLRERPVHDVLVGWYEHIQIDVAYARAMPEALQAAARAQLAAVLAYSQNMASGRFVTPYELVRDLMSADREVAWPVPPQAVRLMTIHGAKGLESKLVVLMDTHAPPQKAQSMAMLWDWPLQAQHPKRVIFVMRESRPPLCAQRLLEQERLARSAEDANLLYVGLTRAADSLWVSGHLARGDTSQSWYELLSAAGVGVAPDVVPLANLGPTTAGRQPLAHVKRMAGEPIRPSLTGTDALPADGTAHGRSNESYGTHPRIRIQDLPTSQKGPTSADDEGVPDDDEIARIGRAMHALLQWHQSGEVPSDAALACVRVTEALSDEALARAAAWAQSISLGEAAWAWDHRIVDRAHAEIDVAWEGRLLRLDRVVRRRDTGQWWVLDFKSALRPAQHDALREQVRNYARAWAHAHPAQQVRAALIGRDGRLWPLEA